MADPATPLGGAVFEGAVTVREVPTRGMITLRGDLSAEPVQRAAGEAGGVHVPGPPGIAFDGGRGIAWMSPDELMIFVPSAEVATTCAAMRRTLERVPHLLADVSDARALLALEGAGAREVLAKGAPVDLAPGRFEPGEIRRTRLGQIAVAFWMTGPDRFELMCFRSVAGFAFDWLAQAAREGSLPEHF